MKTRFLAGILLAVLLSTGCHKQKNEPPMVFDVTMNKTELILWVGDTAQLSATVTPALTKNKQLTWSSNKPDVATVDAFGLVKGVAPGEAIISAIVDEDMATCWVKVKEIEPEPTGNIDMQGMSAEEVAKAIDAALKAGITDFKLTGPITLCGIGDSKRANPFAYNTTVTTLDLSGTTGWPTVEFGSGATTDRITGVPQESFAGCTALTRIALPNEIKAMGLAAFQSCTALSNIDLSHITHIDNAAFKNAGLTGTLSLPEAVYVAPNAFTQCEKLTRVTLSRITIIGESTFAQCSALQQVSAPEATQLGENAFAQCPALTSVDMPQVQRVGNSAFNACKMLTEIVLPQTTHIGNYAFSSCSALKTVSMPLVTEICDYAFGDCKSIEILEFPQATKFGLFIVSGCSSLSRLELPATGSFYTIDSESGTGNVIGSSVFNNTPFKNPPLFSSKGCTLVLNSDKQAGSTSSIAPQANSNQWAGCTWKEIVFE